MEALVPSSFARLRSLVGEVPTKDLKRAKPVQADIVGLTIPNKFVVGFGMDVYGYWRNLPGLWAIREEDLKPRD